MGGSAQVDPQALLSVCRLLIERNLYRESVPLLTRSVDQLPASGEAHYLLALALFQTDRVDRMVPLLDRALLLQPDFVPALLLQAMRLLEVKKLSEAKRPLGKALELEPGEPKAIYLLSKVMIEEGEYPEAIRSLNRLIDRFPNDPDVHLLLLSAYRKDENYQKAFEYSLQLLTLFPDHPLVLYNVGLDLEILGRFEEAETHLRRALSMTRNAPELQAGARLGLARVLAKQEKTVEAIPSVRGGNPRQPGWGSGTAGFERYLFEGRRIREGPEAAQASSGPGTQEKADLHPTGEGAEKAGEKRGGQRAGPHLSATGQGRERGFQRRPKHAANRQAFAFRRWCRNRSYPTSRLQTLTTR